MSTEDIVDGWNAILFLSATGGFQCLLTMSLTPIAVSYGSGPSYEMARKQAAFNGLQYLKVMTRK